MDRNALEKIAEAVRKEIGEDLDEQLILVLDPENWSDTCTGFNLSKLREQFPEGVKMYEITGVPSPAPNAAGREKPAVVYRPNPNIAFVEQCEDRVAASEMGMQVSLETTFAGDSGKFTVRLTPDGAGSAVLAIINE